MKAPDGVDIDELTEHICEIDGVLSVHHIHLWSPDGCNNYATMHIVTDLKGEDIKNKVRKELAEHGIVHATLETEVADEICNMKTCCVDFSHSAAHAHHHHHH